jgi:hypothetical protein
VRLISTATFQENLRGAYGGGEGANNSEGLAWLGRGACTARKECTR